RGGDGHITEDPQIPDEPDFRARQEPRPPDQRRRGHLRTPAYGDGAGMGLLSRKRRNNLAGGGKTRRRSQTTNISRSQWRSVTLSACNCPALSSFCTA